MDRTRKSFPTTFRFRSYVACRILTAQGHQFTGDYDISYFHVDGQIELQISWPR